MINLRETCVFPLETQGLYSTARVHNFFRPGRNGNSVGSEVTHRPMAAEINRCRLCFVAHWVNHSDGTMSAMASEITCISIVYHRLFRPRLNKSSKLRVTGLYEGNSPVTGEFSAQRASNAENIPFDDVITTRLSTRCLKTPVVLGDLRYCFSIW